MQRGEGGASVAWTGHRRPRNAHNGRAKSLDAPGGGEAAAAGPYSAACRNAGAAAFTSASTCTSNLAKFLVNMSTSARAC
jgi:hypothetical protein